MKKLISILLALFLLVVAVALSSLNAEPVLLNLYWYQTTLPLGFLLLVFAVFGMLCGLVLSVIWWWLPVKKEATKWRRQFNQLNDAQLKQEERSSEHSDLML